MMINGNRFSEYICALQYVVVDLLSYKAKQRLECDG